MLGSWKSVVKHIPPMCVTQSIDLNINLSSDRIFIDALVSEGFAVSGTNVMSTFKVMKLWTITDA